MLLITGATGFVGRALLTRLAQSQIPARCLLRPAKRTPNLPRGVPVQVSIASFGDPRALRSALVGVDTILHLASAEWLGPRADLLALDVNGTRALLEAAREAGVQRLIYLSHLGADRASAYPALKAKGIAEEFIRQSGLDYVIIRSALAFGPEDRWVNALAVLLRLLPIAALPGDGRTLTQPIWIDDLTTCLEWSLSDTSLNNQTVSIGGPEFLSVRQLAEEIAFQLRLTRQMVAVHPLVWRGLAWFNEQVTARGLLASRLLDHLAVNRVCELTSVTRYFGLRPTRFSAALGYLPQQKLLPQLRYLLSGQPL